MTQRIDTITIAARKTTGLVGSAQPNASAAKAPGVKNPRHRTKRKRDHGDQVVSTRCFLLEG